MTIDQIISLIAQHGGTFAFAVVAIWMLNRVWADRLKEAKKHAKEAEEYAKDIRSVWEQTLQALQNNTEVMTRLVERLDGGKE